MTMRRPLAQRTLTVAAVFRSALTAALLATALAPAVAAQSRATPPSPVRTFRADSFWDHRWVRGGADEDELLIEPRFIAVADSVVTVLDLGSREVLAVNAKTGKTLFVKQARGAGPGEFKRPAFLLGATNQFGVLDHESARLSMFSNQGTLVWDAPVLNAFDVEGACALPNARVLLKSASFDKSLTVIDSTGKIRLAASLPRIDQTVEPPSFTETAHMAGPFAGDRCAVVPIFGARWYAVDARGTVTPHAYVVPGENPVVQVTSKVLEKRGRDEVQRQTQTTTATPIASGTMHRGDTLIVISGSGRTDAGRILDYYALPSGRYVYSRRLPMSFTSLTIAPNGTFYGTVIGPDWSAITALLPTRSAPSREKAPRRER